MRSGSSTRLTAAAAAGLLLLTACGGGDSAKGGGGTSDTGGDSSKTVVWGTTDKPVSFDPAGSYDLPSWNIVYNVYQNLMRVDAGSVKPVPDAAKSCDSDDTKTWTCKLNSGLKFSNGDPLDASVVKASFQRVLDLKDPNGPSTLLEPIDTMDTPDDSTIVFNLKEKNAIWPFILSTGAGAIVDTKVYPKDKLQDDAKIIGSGPYKLATYQAGQVAQLKPNDSYTGDLKRKNSGMLVQYYQDANSLKLDIQGGKVDVAYRNLTPTDINDLKTKSNLKVVDGPGGEIRYMVFNLNTMGGTSPEQKLAVRKAVAMSVDRDSIAKNVYQGTVDPLYSMVPQGVDGHIDSYADAYGKTPDKAKAEAALKAGGLTTPVPLDLWWTPSHYGALTGDEYTEIKRQLEGTGLFTVNLKSTEWQQYSKAAFTDSYPQYGLGWFPDYPDPDNYSAPFVGSKTNFTNNHYSNPTVDELISTERSTTDQSARDAAFKKIQTQTAADVPYVPIWQGKQIAVVGKDVTGVKDTLDPSYIFRMWLVGKS